MLVIDVDDGLGDERAWVGTADSIGATVPAKYGAHNGWHAAGNSDPNNPANFVRAHIGQPGTTWDLYQVRYGWGYTIAAGTIGSRLAFSEPSNTQIYGKRSRQGPSVEMLSAYYRMILLLTGRSFNYVLGPATDKSQDDVGLLQQWLAAGNPSTPNRGLWTMGQSVIESNSDTPVQPALIAFDSNYLGVGLRDGSYTLASGNPELSIDLNPSAALSPLRSRFGLSSSCLKDHDVLSLDPAL